ncbi:QWRF motif-containing protein 8 [Dorcoceras hygrometricum]|uniref:QWRF motif-containing protein 8 n=1 Tax=Dorcoceras hygrometricum TaxID=472368 RepID=A0A2Z7BRK3_9LAMI|nr:QWRF motif-containing protein 8 [Dorcoceras hygrometricum]
MDVCELPESLEKQSISVATKPPSIQAVNNHGILRSRIGEVSSRYKSPASSTGPKLCPSPNTSRTAPTSTESCPKRAVSAERKRSLGPLSPPSPSPSTPVQDTSSEMLMASKWIAGKKFPGPSRSMRSLSVSFKSDIISVPMSKREKPVSNVLSDRVLRPSSNIAHKQAELPASRKPTPERKGTPNKGRRSSDKSENSKPTDSLPASLVHQHRWPTRVNGRASSTAVNRDINLTDKMNKTASLSHSMKAELYPRRLSLDGTPLQKFTNDLLMIRTCCDNGKVMLNGCLSDDSSMMIQSASSSAPDKTPVMYAAARTQYLPTPVLRSPSPPVSRGVSPARNKVGKPSSRGPSPARVRPSSPSRQPQTSTSVLSFIADIKKGNKAATHIEDVHQLRLLYNRHLQWQYANARSDAVLNSLKVKAEKILYNMWRTIASLLDSATAKRTHLQQLRLILKLYSILDNQLTCLDQWALVESGHANSLTLVTQELQAATIRIPVAGGARGDIGTIKAAVCSAVDVMQAMGSSLCSILSQMEGMNSLVSQVADIAAQERAMLADCESLMSIAAAFQSMNILCVVSFGSVRMAFAGKGSHPTDDLRRNQCVRAGCMGIDIAPPVCDHWFYVSAFQEWGHIDC